MLRTFVSAAESNGVTTAFVTSTSNWDTLNFAPCSELFSTSMDIINGFSIGETRVVLMRTFKAERTAIVRLALRLKTGAKGGG